MWMIYGLIAVVLQTTRNAIQKELAQSIPRLVVTWIRCVFALPFLSIYYVVLVIVLGEAVYAYTWQFWLFAIAGGTFQIIASTLMLKAFALRSFMIGSCYGKSDSIQTALLGWILFSEALNPWAFVVICTSFSGILLISLKKESMSIRSFFDIRKNESTRIGLLIGTFFSLTALCIRQSILQLEASSILMASSTTLLVTIILQVIVLSLRFLIWDKGALASVRRNMGKASIIGLTNCLSSVTWYLAFGLINASYVTALGQIQMPLSIAYSRFVFRETLYAHELIGAGIIVVSIIILTFL